MLVIFFTKKSTQIAWPKQHECNHCGKTAVFHIPLKENGKSLAHFRPDDAKIWPHDSTAFGIYICPECGNSTVIWDQY